jgi:hypothetical protein
MLELLADKPCCSDRDDERPAYRVIGAFVARFPLVSLDHIVAVPGLRDLPILRFHQTPNYALTDEEAERLAQLVPVDSM